jgi:hypothetical protein
LFTGSKRPCEQVWTNDSRCDVVRNVYTFDFDPEQMALLIRRLPDARGRVHNDLSAFADTLERIAGDDEPADSAL